MNSVICLIYKQAHLTHLKSHTSTVNIFKILISKNCLIISILLLKVKIIFILRKIKYGVLKF